jgi:hypothetical protein
MVSPSVGGLRCPELHARAALAARALGDRFGPQLSEEAREVIGYWRSVELAFERAARHVITYAAAVGVRVPPVEAPRHRDGGPEPR